MFLSCFQAVNILESIPFHLSSFPQDLKDHVLFDQPLLFLLNLSLHHLSEKTKNLISSRQQQKVPLFFSS